MKPITRVQRRRTKGFKLQDQSPDGRPVKIVSRPSQWGNPNDWRWYQKNHYCSELEAKQMAQSAYANPIITRIIVVNPDYLLPLKDHHLACWCKIGEPCHADTLVQLVNEKYADEN